MCTRIFLSKKFHFELPWGGIILIPLLISIVTSSNPIVSCLNACNLHLFNNSHSFHNFHKNDYPSIIKFISAFDCISTISTYDIICAVNLFIDYLHNIFIPLHIVLLIYSPLTCPYLIYITTRGSPLLIYS